MALTTQQRATLLAAIKADPVAGPMRAAGDGYSLELWCNAASSTQAWRSAVPAQSVDEAATYTTYDSLVQGKRDSWAIFLMFPRDFTKSKIRGWVTDVWGSATLNSISEAILIAGTEAATNAQAAIGGTARSTGTVTAINRNFSEAVTTAEVAYLISAA
jgi:hypothetical protein